MEKFHSRVQSQSDTDVFTSSPTRPKEQSHDEPIVLKHPFTMCISGPTSCGKTYLTMEILMENKIYPRPQRIIWLYKRWQPFYDALKTGLDPRIEFIQGIPVDLEKDSFLNPKVRNLIVLDDLMSTASKDQRVTDLFTEGSHHRNLSVIAINQNLYHSKDPTQRRNCHYMVLFNNPVDQQPVMTLARQMYPSNPERFMKAFRNSVTQQRYGYLFVDLKPTTSDEKRLIANGLTIADVSDDDDEEEKDPPETSGRKRSWHEYCGEDYHVGGPSNPTLMPPRLAPRQDLLSCKQCGLIIKGVLHLTNHIRRVHCHRSGSQGQQAFTNAAGVCGRYSTDGRALGGR